MAGSGANRGSPDVLPDELAVSVVKQEVAVRRATQTSEPDLETLALRREISICGSTGGGSEPR